MAKIDVIMPQMGESIAEGTLSRWIKKVGDPVKRDEPIFEISTDKVDAEIPAPGAGVLAEILVQEGQTVAVQTVVARIETDAAAVRARMPIGRATAERKRARADFVFRPLHAAGFADRHRRLQTENFFVKFPCPGHVGDRVATESDFGDFEHKLLNR